MRTCWLRSLLYQVHGMLVHLQCSSMLAKVPYRTAYHRQYHHNSLRYIRWVHIQITFLCAILNPMCLLTAILPIQSERFHIDSSIRKSCQDSTCSGPSSYSDAVTIGVGVLAVGVGQNNAFRRDCRACEGMTHRTVSDGLCHQNAPIDSGPNEIA